MTDDAPAPKGQPAPIRIVVMLTGDRGYCEFMADDYVLDTQTMLLRIRYGTDYIASFPPGSWLSVVLADHEAVRRSDSTKL